MEEAKQELKNLMNDLFVNDLLSKTDALKNEISIQFQGAVNDFTNGYQNFVDKTTKKIIEPKIQSLNSLIKDGPESLLEIIEGSIKSAQTENIKRMDQIEGSIKSVQTENIKRMDQIEGSIKSAQTENIKRMDQIEGSIKSVQTENIKRMDQIEGSIKSVQAVLKTEGETLFERYIMNEQLILKKTKRIIVNSYLIFTLVIIETLLLLYMWFFLVDK